MRSRGRTNRRGGVGRAGSIARRGLELLEPRWLLSGINDAPALPGYFHPTNGVMLFVNEDAAHGVELWRSDGTQGGTYLLKDINPGPADALDDNLRDPRERFDPEPRLFATVGNVTYFAADDGVNGRELWRTDGTSAGTVMVKDLHPGRGGSSLWNIFDAGGQVYFVNDDVGSPNMRLWKVAPGGTVAPITSNAFDYLTEVASVSGRLLYVVSQTGYGDQLWTSDGTPKGTRQVYWNIDVQALRVGTFGGKFVVADVGGNELWLVEPDLSKQTLLRSFPPYSRIALVDSVPGKLMVTATRPVTETQAGAQELWASDGTAAGTKLVWASEGAADYNLATDFAFTAVGGQVYFTDATAVRGKLWKTDGTAAGTVLVHDDGLANQRPAALVDVGGTLYFGDGYKLWKSGGTAATTVPVADLMTANVSDPYGAVLRETAAVNGRLFFGGWDAFRAPEVYTYAAGAGGGLRMLQTHPSKVVLSAGVLTIDGWSYDDRITLNVDAVSGKVTVYWNDAPSATYSAPNGVLVRGNEGNDEITVTGRLSKVTLDGGDGGDSLTGGDGDDLIVGGDGWDVIYGGGGKDTLRGGAGNDQVWGGDGDDEMYAEDGETGNTLWGGRGNDRLWGGDGADQLNGDQDDDYLFGGRGNDWLDGGPGADAMFGWKGMDEVYYTMRTENLVVRLDGIARDGGPGEKDNVSADVERVRLGRGNDTFVGSAGVNEVFGGRGHDTIDGAGGDDTLDGDGGNDVLIGGAGNDRLIGDVGTDWLYGNAGNDSLDSYGYGDVAPELVDGGPGTDWTTSKNKGPRKSIEKVF